ncbi:MAG: dTDP-glucose 4,6-dehydratase [Bradymonadaceae bacterium]
MSTHYIVTGGAGFIGANLVHYLLRTCPETRITVIDKLTYAGNRRYLAALADDDRLDFVQADVADGYAMEAIFQRTRPDGVFHLAAESHVDRSITGPDAFIRSNVVGTFTLLECARKNWVQKGKPGRFLHVSTDEVYGSLGPEGYFTEATPYDPSSPYSATKASSDHLVRAYHRTYGLDAVITNCSNNFGPFQFPEKLIPVIIRNIRDKKTLPVYGDGKNVRDWLYVEDHCTALWQAFSKGRSGRSYNIGAQNEWSNIDLVRTLCDLVDDTLGRPHTSQELIEFVTDRPGHDQRYAIDSSRMKEELGWTPAHEFEAALKTTVIWYLENMQRLWNV